MSLTDVASSTLSTIINNIFIVIKDGNNNNNSSNNNNLLRDIKDNNYESIQDKNTTILQSVFTPMTTKVIYVYQGQGVAYDISQEKIITVMCLLIIFSLFGCLGNGLVLYVFTKKSDKVTSTIFILALAWTDFFTCLIIMPFTVANIGLDSRLHFDFLCRAYQFLITSNVPLSAFIMVAIAVDRYFSICHPFMRVVTPRRARVAIICLVVVACTLGSITACIYGVWSQPVGNETTTSNSNNNCCNESVTSSYQSYLPTSEEVQFSESSLILANKDVEIIINNSSFETLPVNTTLSSSEQQIVVIGHSEGLCWTNEFIFTERFTELYQKIYISFYIIALLAVFTLYFFIYRSVAERREWRRKQKSFSHTPMVASTAVTATDNCKKRKDSNCGGFEHLELTIQSSSLDASNSGSKENGAGNGSENAPNSNSNTTILNKTGSSLTVDNKKYDHENGVDTADHNLSAEKKIIRERRDFNFLANIRTAIMLFVVTLVFIISFLPAWLMATHLINFEITIFYMHFIYNVANPVIYAFMNQSFRKELKRVFQRGTHLLRGG